MAIDQKTRSRAHYVANRDTVLARVKASYDPVKKAAYDKKRREERGARLNAERRAQRERDGERLRAQERARHAANPILRLSANAVRRTIEREGDFTVAQWDELIEEFDGRCAYCQAQAALQIEHMTPLSRGGRHTKSNIVPACAPCNGKKYARTIFEFLAVS